MQSAAARCSSSTASKQTGVIFVQILSFYMGKNMPEGKDYIMENLPVTVER